MYCKNCGKEISDNAYVCPHCGVKAGDDKKEVNTLSIIGFILSFFISIAGLVCCIIARKQIRERDEDGAGLALAGLIISIVLISLSVIGILIVIINLIIYGSVGSVTGAVISGVLSTL